MRSKLLAIGSTLLLVTGLFTLGAMSANAHTPVVTPTCGSIYVHLANYQTDHQHGGVNTYSVTIDGQVVASSNNFGTDYENTFSVDPTKAVPYTVTYTAWDHVPNQDSYSGTKSGVTPTCVVKDASAAYSFTAPTCSTAQVLVLGVVVNATWGPVTYSGLDNRDFSVTATATTNHKFTSNNLSTLTITGTLLPATGNCPPPPCLPDTAVSYTYNSANNSGVITVTGDANAQLCRKLYVVAASWTFDGLNKFPQSLDQWNPANSGNAIQAVGTYPYAAIVGCGQGDIYSSWDVPVPTLNNGTLTASGTPYAEHFLHQDVSPGSPNTWTVGTPSLCKAAAGVAFAGYTCNSYAPLVLSGSHVSFTVEYKDAPTGTFTNVASGSYELLANFSGQAGARYFGDLTVTPHADAGFSLVGSGAAVPLTASLPQNCPKVVDVVPAATAIDVCGTANDKVNTPTDTTSLDYTETWNPAHTSDTVTVVAKAGFTIKSGVKTTWTFDYSNGGGFTDVACPYTDVIGDPLAAPQSCVNGVINPGHVWVDFGESAGFINPNLRSQVNYKIEGTDTSGTHHSIPVASNEVNPLPPGAYLVTVTAKPGFVLNPAVTATWNLVIASAGNCQLIDHPLVDAAASMKQLSCSGGGSYTLANTTGVLWYVNGSATPTPAGTYSVSKASKVVVAAGLLNTVDYGWQNGQPPPWVFTFSSPIDCLPTLAFTGAGGANLGLLLSGGFLLFGGTITAVDRRLRFDRN